MDFHYINTNASNREGDTYKRWLRLGYAFTSGNKKRYGKKLAKLHPGDIVFMYVSDKGVRAVGMVIKEWDGIEYHEPIIPSSPDRNEYRIQINWFIVPPDEFVSPSKVRELVGYDLVGTTARIISNRDGAEKLLKHMLQMQE